MTTCPVMMMSNLTLDSSSPSNSPQSRLRSSSKSSPSPITKLPNIVAHSTPPSSPSLSTTRFSMTASSPPPSPGCRKIMPSKSFTTSGLSNNSLTITPPTPMTTTSPPSNTRLQPVAQRTPSAKSGGKRKLGPGCGLLDWIRLCRSKTDLTGNGGSPRPVTLEELAEHNKEDDAWTAIRGEFILHDTLLHLSKTNKHYYGIYIFQYLTNFSLIISGKVYNLTYYMKFHPGGKSELMRGAGIDCTILFDEVSCTNLHCLLHRRMYCVYVGLKWW